MLLFITSSVVSLEVEQVMLFYNTIAKSYIIGIMYVLYKSCLWMSDKSLVEFPNIFMPLMVNNALLV